MDLKFHTHVYNIHPTSIVHSIAFRMGVSIHEASSYGINWKSDDCTADGSHKEGCGFDEVIVTESGPEAFIKVVERDGESDIEDNVFDYIGATAFEQLVLRSESLKSSFDSIIVSSPLLLDLSVKDLANIDENKWSGYEGSNSSRKPSQQCFFSISQIIGHFDWF